MQDISLNGILRQVEAAHGQVAAQRLAVAVAASGYGRDGEAIIEVDGVRHVLYPQSGVWWHKAEAA